MPVHVKPPTLDEKLKDMGKSLDEFAQEIQLIARGMSVLKESLLRENTIIMLVARASGVSQQHVKDVPEALPTLDQKFLKTK